jgi:hypothetical protein
MQTDISEMRTASMEAVGTPETSVHFYESTRSHIPEGCHLHPKDDYEDGKSQSLICGEEKKRKFIKNCSERIRWKAVVITMMNRRLP